MRFSIDTFPAERKLATSFIQGPSQDGPLLRQSRNLFPFFRPRKLTYRSIKVVISGNQVAALLAATRKQQPKWACMTAG